MIEVFYDGDCIFCKSYIRLKHLRAAAGDVELVSIRSGDARLTQLAQEGYNLNTGMLVRYGEHVYYGADAIRMLGRLEKLGAGDARTTPGYVLWRVFYPLLVLGRMLTLLVMGKSLYAPGLYSELGVCPAPLSYRVFRIALMLGAGLFFFGLLLFCVGAYADPVVHAVNAWLGHPVIIMDREITAARLQKFAHTRMALDPVQVVAACAYFGMVIAFFFREKWPRRLFDNLARGKIKYWVFYTLFILLVVNVYSAIPLRRAMFCILCLPVSALAIGMAAGIYRDKRGGFLPAFLVVIGALNLCIPGFFIPPFSDGIAGWTSNATTESQYTFSGYKLQRDDGQEIWYSSALFNPVTMIGRFDLAFLSKGSSDQFEDFMISNYKRLWPDVLSKNLMPHQAFWGAYGYPPHTHYNPVIKYGDFPPARIKNIILVRETVDSNKKILSHEVLRSRKFN